MATEINYSGGLFIVLTKDTDTINNLYIRAPTCQVVEACVHRVTQARSKCSYHQPDAMEGLVRIPWAVLTT